MNENRELDLIELGNVAEETKGVGTPNQEEGQPPTVKEFPA